MTIARIEGAPLTADTSILLEIDNQKLESSYSLNFTAADVMVHDDQNQAYPVDQVNFVNVDVRPGTKWRNPEIWVRGHPSAAARTWTVVFKTVILRPPTFANVRRRSRCTHLTARFFANVRQRSP
jgi:hypothetical protein